MYASKSGFACEDEWDLLCSSENDCSCLQYIEDRATYSLAERVCKGSGAKLPIIHSELKNKFLFVYPDDFSVGAWIGLQKNDNGQFIWANGNPLTWMDFQNWEGGKPVDNGDCVHFVGDSDKPLSPNEDFKWRNSKCSQYRPILCEKEPVRDSSTHLTTMSLTCPQEYKEKCFQDNSCYCYAVKKDTPTYWGDAIAVCRSEDADMVSIHSDDENEYIREIAGMLDFAWIGSLYSSTKWIDGTKMSGYTNWHETYDDHTLGYINLAYGGKWMTVSDFGIKLPFVCKKPKE
ncbi:hypothetical protein QYM36_004570 [Artemia franciscana]|uniref:C-type lectin domain-containing protein n=2 Tax=Artemia franciscana TaxID=6661 RepID=A0AA88I3W6_ARTSF|nr:hypothetical protein QYM36_004570 [Artemia franciscana]